MEPQRQQTGGARDALGDVLGQTKEVAKGHLELRTLEMRALVEAYASRTFAACVAILFGGTGLCCLVVAAVLALAQVLGSLAAGAASVGVLLFVITALLLRRAGSPVEVQGAGRSALPRNAT